MSFIELAESLGHEVDEASAEILARLENKSVALKFIRRLPKKKATPKKAKKASKKESEE
tara:strand:- start:283 stop:459 length:177 start_codon:yes stop_codon:yes gene_type:complete